MELDGEMARSYVRAKGAEYGANGDQRAELPAADRQAGAYQRAEIRAAERVAYAEDADERARADERAERLVEVSEQDGRD